MIRSRMMADWNTPANDLKRRFISRAERAALVATDRGARMGLEVIRSALAGAGAARLGGALGASSDLRKGRIFREGGKSSASGVIYIRGRSERATGAIISYTEGGEIRPNKGPWLWIPSYDAPQRVGRYRLTPSRWAASGLEAKYGPLISIPGRHSGERLLVVKEASISRAGRRGYRPIGKTGRVGKTRERQEMVVMFVGILRTSRVMRANAREILRQVHRQMPRLIEEAFKR